VVVVLELDLSMVASPFWRTVEDGWSARKRGGGRLVASVKFRLRRFSKDFDAKATRFEILNARSAM
jgi:hypothetical protein